MKRDRNKLAALDLGFAQGLRALDLLKDSIIEARQKAKTEGSDNFFFDYILPFDLAECDNGFARITCNGDIYTISFHRGISQPGIVSISKTLH